MTQDHGHSLAEIRERIRADASGSHLRDAIYGGIDGAVTTFALVSGVAGAGLPTAIIIALGFANVLSDGFSMAAANYSGTKSDQENLERLRAIEVRHIKEYRAGELTELREILRQKGLGGDVLDDATEAISQNEQAWIDLMLVDEYGVSPVDPAPIKAALVTFAAFLLAGVVPLIPFILSLSGPFTVSVVATLMTFFLIGTIKSRWSMIPWWRSGIETFLIGGTAAGIAFGVGLLFRNTT